MIDWKERAQRAEAALKLARSGIKMLPPRRAVLELLANGTYDEWFTAAELASVLGWSPVRVRLCLDLLVSVGLVEKDPARGTGAGQRGYFRLGYLVTLGEETASS